MFQIPLKAKYKPEDKLYGYQRNHAGNGNKKKKKLGVGFSHPYVKTDHVLVLKANGKKRFVHYQDARNILS